MTTPDEARKALHEYEAMRRRHEDEADQLTPPAMEAAGTSYNDRDAWVDAWAEEHPVSKYANNKDPGNKSRYYTMQRTRAEAEGLLLPSASMVYKLVQGWDIVQVLDAEGLTGQTLTERTVRPLSWLTRYKYEDRIPEVFKGAVSLAGSADKVTAPIVRQAVTEWKRDKLGAKAVRKSVRQSKAQRLYNEAVLDFDELVLTGDSEYINKFLDHVTEQLRRAGGEAA